MKKKNDKKSMVMTYVLIGMVIAVLVFSVMQTFVINDLQQTLAQQAFSGASAAVKTAAPTMVGGC